MEIHRSYCLSSMARATVVAQFISTRQIDEAQKRRRQSRSRRSNQRNGSPQPALSASFALERQLKAFHGANASWPICDEKIWGTRLTMVFPGQGHYALDPK